MKQAKYIALCLALLVLLAGCHKGETQEPEETVTPAVEESESPEPSESEEPEEEENPLTGLETYANSRAVNENGDVFLTAKLANDAMLGEKYIYSLSLYDLGEDNIVANYVLSDTPAQREYYGDDIPGEESMLASYNMVTGLMEGDPIALPEDYYEGEDWCYSYQEVNGSTLWLRQVSEDQLTATSYDSKLNPGESFQNQVGTDIYGYFSQDGTKYYICQNGRIVRYAVDGSDNGEQLTISQTFSVSSLWGLFTDGTGHEYARVEGIAGDLFTYQGVVDLNTGELVYLSQEPEMSLYIEGNTLVAQQWDETESRYVISTAGTPYTYTWSSEEYLNYQVLSNHDILFYYTTGGEDGENGELCLGLFDTATGTLLSSTSMQADINTIWLAQVMVSPQKDNELILMITDEEANTWFYSWEYGGANHEMDAMSVAETVLPEPMVPEISDEWDPSILTPGECPEELSDLRERADQIEEEYGINIYISQECRNYVGGYVVMEESDYDTVSQALDVVEEQLSLYPDGFFQQFQGEWLDGIDLYLAGTLMGRSNGVLDYAGGFQLENAGSIMIVLDCSWPGSLTTSLHHELSHAIESKIDWESNVTLDETQWQTLNPDTDEYGDSYAYSYVDAVPEAMEPFVYDWDDPTDAYFIDEYSLTYPTEDRARIFEYVMCPDNAWIDFDDTPYLKEKLNYYVQVIREAFDTTGWEDVRWERYLDN